LDLALRIMFTLDIRLDPSSADCMGGRQVSVRGRGHALLRLSSSSFNMKAGRIEPGMAMAYLSNHKGFTVCWTSNLADQLAINLKSRVLGVYKHKICLWNYLNSPGSCIIPREILKEAIDTLHLLFGL
jgi:hypothetical protein